MKKLTALLLATAMVFPAAANAKPADNNRTQITHKVSKDTRDRSNAKVVKTVTVTKKNKVAAPRFATGQRFDRKRAVSYQVVDHRVNRARLRAAPRGYNWIRSGRDVYLVRTSNGLIASVVSGIFR